MAPDTPFDPPPSLREVVVQLEAVLHPLGDEQPPILVGVEATGDVEFRIPPPRSGSVIDAVVGFDAPADWSAVGVIASGRAHDIDADGPAPAPSVTGSPRRVRMGHVVARTGSCVSFLRFAGGDPTFDEEPHEGRVGDVCRRMLGLPTATPAVSVEAYWASRWLEQVIAAGDACSAYVAAWERVAVRHLAAHGWAAPPSVPALVEAGRRLAEAAPWEVLRLEAASGRRRCPGVDRAAARWMDEGMFSRWAMQDSAPLDHLRATVAGVVPPAVSDAIDDVLAGWGLT